MVTGPVKSTFLILVGGVIQARRPASFAQKASGSRVAASVMARWRSAVTSALAAISGFTAISSSDIWASPLGRVFDCREIGHGALRCVNPTSSGL